MKDKYLFRKKSSDYYFGRCASCFEKLKKEFAVYLPYFNFKEMCEIDKLDRYRKISQLLDTCLPKYTSISDKTNKLTMCCFETICFHHDNLKAMLH